MTPEEAKQPWQRRRLPGIEQRARDRQWSEMSARWDAEKRVRKQSKRLENAMWIAALASPPRRPASQHTTNRTAAVPRRWDGQLDVNRMIAEGRASVAAIEGRQQARYDRHAGDRRRGMELFESVRAQRFGPRLGASRPASALAYPFNGQPMGAVPPEPSQTRPVIF